MKTYDVVNFPEGGQSIKYTLQNGVYGFIPLDPRNGAYQEYLRYQEWVSQGKTPEDFWTSEEGIDGGY